MNVNWKHFSPLIFSLAFANFVFAAEIKSPETVTVEAGSFMYRASGEYQIDGYPINAPLHKITFISPIKVMKYHVQVGSYELCVVDNYCNKRYYRSQHADNFPATGISYNDAIKYAKWLSNKTDSNWRLPTDKEWAYIAGTRFIDDSINDSENKNNPSIRWLEKYKKYTKLENGTDNIIKPIGSFGANENGIFDLSVNVWEWTSSCYKRTRLDKAGIYINSTNNCGVRISAGRHRAYITSFIQNAKGGGCSVGAPPNYLGFRLIQEANKTIIQELRETIGF